MEGPFEDGYRAAEVCDAIVRSGESGGREQISCRALGACEGVIDRAIPR